MHLSLMIYRFKFLWYKWSICVFRMTSTNRFFVDKKTFRQSTTTFNDISKDFGRKQKRISQSCEIRAIMKKTRLFPRENPPTKKRIFVFSTTNTVLLRIYRDFRNCILLVYRRYGRSLPFSYLSLQTTKLLHSSRKRTCRQHWRKERLNTSGMNDDWQHAYT